VFFRDTGLAATQTHLQSSGRTIAFASIIWASSIFLSRIIGLRAAQTVISRSMRSAVPGSPPLSVPPSHFAPYRSTFCSGSSTARCKRTVCQTWLRRFHLSQGDRLEMVLPKIGQFADLRCNAQVHPSHCSGASWPACHMK
jgi:hypothetical protein